MLGTQKQRYRCFSLPDSGMFSEESGDSILKQMRTAPVLRPQPVIVLLPSLLGGHLRCNVRGPLRRSFLFPAVMLGTQKQRYRCFSLPDSGMFSEESGDSILKQMRTAPVLRPQPVIVLLPSLLGGHLRCNVRGPLRRSFLFPAVMLGTQKQRYRCFSLPDSGMFSEESGDSILKQMRTAPVLRPQPVIVLLPSLLGGHLRCNVRGPLRRSFLFPAVMLGTQKQRYRCFSLPDSGTFSEESGLSMLKPMRTTSVPQSENGRKGRCLTASLCFKMSATLV
ncbi:hypothetical protein MTO96_012011 [Rhipicephalus appendiculatus]